MLVVVVEVLEEMEMLVMQAARGDMEVMVEVEQVWHHSHLLVQVVVLAEEEVVEDILDKVVLLTVVEQVIVLEQMVQVEVEADQVGCQVVQVATVETV
jgi:hypothetical protein